jgi:hypothetical protein
MFEALRLFLARPSDFAWRQCELPLFGGCDICGNRLALVGQVWRRLGPDGKWQYRQNGAVEQDYLDNAW